MTELSQEVSTTTHRRLASHVSPPLIPPVPLACSLGQRTTNSMAKDQQWQSSPIASAVQEYRPDGEERRDQRVQADAG